MAQTTPIITNWSHYNQALKRRGSLSLWISQEAIDAWCYDGPPQWGTDPTYSDFAIEACLRLRLVYHLPLRQTQGFVASLFDLMEIDLPVPDYSTLSRRAGSLSVDLCTCSNDKQDTEPRHILIDPWAGLKVYGEGEWKQRQHGKSKRRTWRKVHISLDPETGEITAERLTGNDKSQRRRSHQNSCGSVYRCPRPFAPSSRCTSSRTPRDAPTSGSNRNA